jgi:hypothetical protein
MHRQLCRYDAQDGPTPLETTEINNKDNRDHLTDRESRRRRAPETVSATVVNFAR